MAEYIDREALRKVLENWRDAHADVDDEHGCGLLEDVIWEVDAQPAADVAPVLHGRWVPFHSKAAGDIQYCSACEIGFDAKTDYCPHCGAKMGGGDGDACVGSNDFCSYGERKDGES